MKQTLMAGETELLALTPLPAAGPTHAVMWERVLHQDGTHHIALSLKPLLGWARYTLGTKHGPCIRDSGWCLMDCGEIELWNDSNAAEESSRFLGYKMAADDDMHKWHDLAGLAAQHDIDAYVHDVKKMKAAKLRRQENPA
jgi:hypothetical protein